MSPTWSGDAAGADGQIAHVRALGEPVMDQVARMPLAAAARAMDHMFGRGNYRLGSRILHALTDEAIGAFTESAEAMPPRWDLPGHAVARVAGVPAPVRSSTDTAPPGRSEAPRIPVVAPDLPAVPRP